ncbi:CG13097 [Drosophila busckii]|uniref:U3 small nucleolar ribonucleoprotein protein MPP10 n=1 Tax=Drosophila busckii TaxID=30019 RepID=A0A0M4ENL6_DROBS|nr:CG13097 [Drosophila busckii]
MATIEAKKPNIFQDVVLKFEELTKQIDVFLKPQPEKVNAIHKLIKETYSVSINGNVRDQEDILNELVLEDMDEEQIWQQLEIRNDLVLKKLVQQTAQMTALREHMLGIELDDDDEVDEESENKVADSSNSKLPSDLSEPLGIHDLRLKSIAKPVESKFIKKGRKSVVDDTFFKLDEMKQFLEQEDAKELNKQKNKNLMTDADVIDYFKEDFGLGDGSDDDENDINANYADFFDIDEELKEQDLKSTEWKHLDYFNETNNEADDNFEKDESFCDAGDDKDSSEIDETEFIVQGGLQPPAESESDDESKKGEPNFSVEEDADKESAVIIKSSNEMREARLFQRIRDYEDVVLGEKPWQLKGEVQAANRPQNSLLEEILEFESTRRRSAPITEEQNLSIEDIIKQRIRDKAWDDVERTIRPLMTPVEYRKQLVLDQEKSKQSLAQIYEQKYQNELAKLDPSHSSDNSTTLVPKEHQEIKKAMRILFLKLDALSNFHFIPKPVAPEVKIVTNTPAVHMEEVAPLSASDAKLLAPEEVYRGPKHTPLGKSERSRTDKNRERRKKKQKQRAINSVMEMREQMQAKQGKASMQRESNAKLLKTITKSRNVQKITYTNDQTALKSSKAFFSKLQDTTTSKTISIGNKRPKDAVKADAKKLKL